MKKYLFHLGHPAHFHLFKNVIKSLKEKGGEVMIVIKKKDVLEDLLAHSKLDYVNILPEGRKDSKFHIAIGQLKQDIKLYNIARKFKPNVMIGTSVAISHVGKLLSVPSINVNEDDAEIVPLYAKLAYPWASCIIAPKVCSVGKWESKRVSYQGYHELSYLHPDHFTPSKKNVEKYFSTQERYFIIRFAKLTAHHDNGIKGISPNIAESLIKLLEPHGRVYITSEREISPQFEKYRININPLDMHHVMAFASIYIGDSQTMAAEAGVLGIPFIRFNDFVGRIGYLKELEEKYELGFGIKPDNETKLYETVKQLLEIKDLDLVFKVRRKKMLNEKINLASFMSWFIRSYPEGLETIKNSPDYMSKFITKTEF